MGAAGKLRYLLFGLVFCVGCGYRVGFVVRGGMKRLWVPVVVNWTLRRGVEYPLTGAILRRLVVQSGVELASSRGEADGELLGELVDYRESVLSETAEDEVLESSVTIVFRFRLRRVVDGEVLLERELVETENFVFQAGEDEGAARRRAFEDLAQRIVFALESWN